MGSLEHATAVCPVEACVLPRNSNMMMILFVGSGVGCCGSLVLYIHTCGCIIVLLWGLDREGLDVDSLFLVPYVLVWYIP